MPRSRSSLAPIAPITIVALALVPHVASAGVFRLYGEARVGGEYGKGISGDQKDEAFAAKRDPDCTTSCSVSPALGYGFVVGGRFLILDGNIKHTQYRRYGLSTWTQFNAGLAFTIDTGSEEEKKSHKGGYFEAGTWLGFGLGTGAQIDPPLDAAQVTDKGFLLEGQIGFGKHLNNIFDIGVAVPVSWGYFFKSGAANDVSNQYQSIQIDAMLVLRANIKFI